MKAFKPTYTKRRPHSLLFVCLLMLLCQAGFSQSKVSRILNRMFNDTSSVEKTKWLAYPTLSYAPETSWEIGVSSVLVYYAKKDTTNRLSEASGFSFFTLEGQYGALFEHALYSHQNKWFGLGKLKFQSYPLSYYGIGTDVSGDELGVVNANFIQIKERLLRNVKGHWYVGLELDFERLSKVSFDWIEGRKPTESILGEDGYGNLGLGLGLVYDNRHNVLNVRHGFLSEVGVLYSEPAWGSTNKFRSLFTDNRAFLKVRKRNVLAFQLLGRFSAGNVPFNQLSLMGGETMMRGYYLGKYRDNNLLAFQTEHRWLPFKFSKRIGGAVFAGVGSVSPNLDFKKFLWSAGGGLRVLIFPKRDIFTRVDVGFTPDGAGFYIFIGEAF